MGSQNTDIIFLFSCVVFFFFYKLKTCKQIQIFNLLIFKKKCYEIVYESCSFPFKVRIETEIQHAEWRGHTYFF